MTLLDSSHTFTLTVAGMDRWSMLRKGALTLTDAEGGQVDTLRFELEDSADALSMTEWQEVIWTADGSAKFFGGYATRVRPRVAPGGAHRIWEVTAESYVTLLNKTPKVRATYVGQTVGAIAAALFTATGLSEFDTATYVTAGATLDAFTVNAEKLTDLLDALAAIAGQKAGVTWAWRIDADKALHLGAASSDAAPFGISDIDTADWATTFPPSQTPEIDTDASDLRNRITVRGGSAPSAETTETFNGDGATVLFGVAHLPIRDIVRITVDGTLQAHGTDWYDTFGGGYDCLVNYAAGTVRWPDVAPPAIGTDNITVVYRYDVATLTTVASAGSYAQYGRYFDYEFEDPAITTDQGAQDAANALLDNYAFAVVSGTLIIERLGLRGGQLLSVVVARLGLSGNYVIRSVTTELDKGGDGVRCTVKFGGRGEKFSGVFAGGIGAGGAYSQPVAPPQQGEIGLTRIRNRIELLDPTTTYVEP